MQFDITEKDIHQAKETLLISRNPLVFKVFPKKEKRKYILLCMLAHLFEGNKKYTESEINDIIRPVYEDFVTIRRYLIDYRFLARTIDCRSYWLEADLELYKRFL